MRSFSFCKPSATKALLLAGLYFLSPVALSAEAALEENAPARRAMPMISPTPTPPPSVRPEELALVQASFRTQLEVARKKTDEENAAAMARLNALDEKIVALGKTGLDQGASFTASLADQKKELVALKETLDASEKKSAESLKKVQEISDNLERKGARMESLLDLMNTLKRDVNDNSREIADVKGAIEKIEVRTRVKGDGSDWWEQIATWRYLPLTAAVLGAVALGFATQK